MEHLDPRQHILVTANSLRVRPADLPSTADFLVEPWIRFVGDEISEDADFEDWVEGAYRLYSAISHWPLESILLRDPKGQRIYRRLSDNVEFHLEDVLEIPVWGAQPSIRHMGSSIDKVGAIDLYYRSKTFARHAGREILEVGFDPERGGLDAATEMAHMAQRGVTKVVLKLNEAKQGIFFIDLKGAKAPDQMHQLIFEHLDWVYVRLEGSSNSAILQPFIPMQFEYRIFMVDGKPVTGAGCIEEFTPLNNRWKAFDTTLRKSRATLDPVETNQETHDLVHGRFLPFAEQFGREMAVEHPEWGLYTLDVALSGDTVVAIELNDTLNSGFYASNPLALVGAYREMCVKDPSKALHHASAEHDPLSFYQALKNRATHVHDSNFPG